MKLFLWLAATSAFLTRTTLASTNNNTNNNSIAEIGAESVLVDDGGCLSLCNGTDACRNDPHSHGSYCKFWQNPAVCFGLYDRGQNATNNQTSNQTSNQTGNATQNLCFQPNDSGCDDLSLPPVICPVQTNTTCALVCSQTASCVSDPTNQGSFCKDNGVCFGLYWTSSNQSSACFAPNDPNCPTTFPVSCAFEGSTTSTPSSTETGAGTTETTTEGVSTETTTETITETTTEMTTSETTTTPI